jgi:hypothetical protein
MIRLAALALMPKLGLSMTVSKATSQAKLLSGV